MPQTDDRNQRRADLRAAMPATAAIVDDLRAAGIGIAAMRVAENGRTVEWGRRLPDRNVPRIPG